MANSKTCILYDTPYVYYNKNKLPPPPKCYFTKCKKGCKISVVDDHVCINGREWKNGKWRITLRALWELFVWRLL